MSRGRLLVTGVAFAALVLFTACQPLKSPPEGPSLPPVPPDGPPPEGSPSLGAPENVVTGLLNPWDLAFVEDGTTDTMFFTERAGKISVRRVVAGVAAVTTLATVPVQTGGELGMLGIAVDPNFAATLPTTPGYRSIYACYATATDVRVVRYVVNALYTGLDAGTPIVSGIPVNTTWLSHAGCRVGFKPGTEELWVTTGDAFDGVHPQNIESLAGKVLRVDRDGQALGGNPFVNAPGDDRIYTFGHRNPQGIAFQPGSGQPYSTEHGTNRDDEVNRLVPGGNGGWDPVPGYNQDVPMTDLVKFPGAMIPAWRSGDAGPFPASATIATAGATFLEGPEWGSWSGALAVACLKGRHVRVMFFDSNGNVNYTTQVLSLGTRLRVAVEGPDNNLYVATDNQSGGDAIWKVTPTPPS